VGSTQATEEAFKELVPQFEKASGTRSTHLHGHLDLQKRVASGEKVRHSHHGRPGHRRLHQGWHRSVAGSRVDPRQIGVARRRAKGGRNSTSAASTHSEHAADGEIDRYSTGPAASTSSTCSRSSASPPRSRPTQADPSVVVRWQSIATAGRIGFQQVSELSLFPGVDYLGPLPAAVQQITVFSAG